MVAAIPRNSGPVIFISVQIAATRDGAGADEPDLMRKRVDVVAERPRCEGSSAVRSERRRPGDQNAEQHRHADGNPTRCPAPSSASEKAMS